MPRQWYHISELCRQATKVLFFQLHTVVKLFFNDTIIFATRHQYQLQPEGDITVCGNNSVCWRLQALFSKNVWNKLRDKILVEICECGWWTEFAKTSVCIILVVLVYLESAKIYTGPEIVRVLKKLRNTVLRQHRCFTVDMIFFLGRHFSDLSSSDGECHMLAHFTVWRNFSIAIFLFIFLQWGGCDRRLITILLIDNK